LQLWDLGGKESLKKLWESYYDDVEGIIYMIDLNSNFIEDSIGFLSNKTIKF
jgi:GTPase SAR1 family protein